MINDLRARRQLARINTGRLTSIYDSRIAFLLDKKQYGVDCLFVFPPRREECPNCIPNSSGLSTGLYKAGGPQKFESPASCPVCKGKGGFEITARESGVLAVLFDVNKWLEPAKAAMLPDGTAQVIGKREDTWDKLITCRHVILNTDVFGEGDVFVLRDTPSPLGLFQAGTQGRSRWFTGYLTRDGGS